MIAHQSLYLGKGLYTPAEAAMYARVQTQLLQRWIFGSSVGQAVVDPEYRDEDGKFVSFLDFVQALAIRAIRRTGFPLQKIRAAYERARTQYSVDYPFATKHRLFLFGDLERPAKCDLVIRVGPECEGADDYRQLTGKNVGNRMLNQIVEPHLRDLAFDESTQLALWFTAYERHGRKILMHPDKRFGEPYLEGSGYTAATLCHAVRTEGTVRAAAATFGVDECDVEVACEYFDYLDGKVGEQRPE